MPDNTCIACGAIILECRHVGLNCERGNDMQTFRPHIRTNSDRIRAMSNRELAEMISKGAPYCKRVSGIVPVCGGGRDCIDCVQEWLESEVQHEADPF